MVVDVKAETHIIATEFVASGEEMRGKVNPNVDSSRHVVFRVTSQRLSEEKNRYPV